MIDGTTQEEVLGRAPGRLGGEHFPVLVKAMGIPSGGYPGMFPPTVEQDIRAIVRSPCLHLFSGSSLIGDVRVDLAHPSATLHMDVLEYLGTTEADRSWEYVLLDPDYEIVRKPMKLRGHARYDSIGGNLLLRRVIEDYLIGHARNVLWLDQCAPRPPGFHRRRLTVYLPGGYNAPRFLSWLARSGERIEQYGGGSRP